MWGYNKTSAQEKEGFYRNPTSQYLGPGLPSPQNRERQRSAIKPVSLWNLFQRPQLRPHPHHSPVPLPLHSCLRPLRRVLASHSVFSPPAAFSPECVSCWSHVSPVLKDLSHTTGSSVSKYSLAHHCFISLEHCVYVLVSLFIISLFQVKCKCCESRDLICFAHRYTLGFQHSAWHIGSIL